VRECFHHGVIFFPCSQRFDTLSPGYGDRRGVVAAKERIDKGGFADACPARDAHDLALALGCRVKGGLQAAHLVFAINEA
jgi:hypothetical protein